MRPLPSIVILRALGLGDFLTGIPAIRALRAAYPAHQVILATQPWLAPLAALTGAIDSVLGVLELAPVPWPGGDPPAIAVDLHGSGPASHRLVTALGAGQTMMYASTDAPDVTGPRWDEDEHEVRRWCRLVQWWGIPADPTALGLARPAGQPIEPGAVLLHPGAASGSRRWPAQRFAAVARTLAAAGYRVLITGSASEKALGLQVAALAGLTADSVVAGRTSLVELAALVADSALLISNDTGVAHLATAYRIPSITLFGPVAPALWGPPAAGGRHLALWHGHGNRPGDPHGGRLDPTLALITVDEVLAAVDALDEAGWLTGGIRSSARR
jgi:ADP-heptose:LPS heptosyltransferase